MEIQGLVRLSVENKYRRAYFADLMNVFNVTNMDLQYPELGYVKSNFHGHVYIKIVFKFYRSMMKNALIE